VCLSMVAFIRCSKGPYQREWIYAAFWKSDTLIFPQSTRSVSVGEQAEDSVALPTPEVSPLSVARLKGHSEDSRSFLQLLIGHIPVVRVGFAIFAELNETHD
jgi:hypothetical protein